MQDASYPEPENLIPASMLPKLITWSDESRKNFVLVAEDDAVVVGGCVFHFLREPDTGFSSFMAVARAARGRGIARMLHEARFRVLDDAARATNGRDVHGVFIDVLNPKRLSPHEFGLEQSVGSDPFVRRKVFAAFGFKRVNLDYQQPFGGANGGPVTNLDLLYCPHPGVDAQTVPLETILGTLRAYWSAWLGESRTAKALERLRGLASGADVLLVDATVD